MRNLKESERERQEYDMQGKATRGVFEIEVLNPAMQSDS